MSKYTFTLFLSIFLIGCATVYNPATERKEVIFINEETEVSLGRNVARQLAAEKALSSNLVQRSRVESIGRKIAQVCDRQTIKYEFSVLEDKEFNAVSLPGGFIYVNSGLADKLNDNELAFVIGHEVGHVAALHSIKKVQANFTMNIILSMALAISGNKDAQGAEGLANISSRVYDVIALGYSRQDEYQADKLGVKYAYKAGFDPHAGISALEKIKKEEALQPEVFVYLRSHPYADDRINSLKKEISKLPPKA